jgi:hypothetical protein
VGSVGRLTTVRSVGRFIEGQDLSLLPASGNASPLQTPTAGARSFREGRLEAEMGLHCRDHRVQCPVSQQSSRGNASTASPPRKVWRHTGCLSAACVAGAFTTAREIASSREDQVQQGTPSWRLGRAPSTSFPGLSRPATPPCRYTRLGCRGRYAELGRSRAGCRWALRRRTATPTSTSQTLGAAKG